MRLLSLSALLLAACSSSSPSRSQAPVQPDIAEGTITIPVAAETAPEAPSEAPGLDELGPKPWTGAFLESSVLLADVIRVEGPEGLLEHMAIASDDALYIRSMETTPEGLLQVIEVKPPAAPLLVDENAPLVRAQLDLWKLAAVRKLIVLERIDAAPAMVIASGEAFYRDVNGQLQNGERLEFTGEIGNMVPLAQLGAAVDDGAEDEQDDAEPEAQPQPEPALWGNEPFMSPIEDAPEPFDAPRTAPDRD